MGKVKMVKNHFGKDPTYPDSCLVTCAGSTGYGKRNWNRRDAFGSPAIYINVDISKCGFVDKPIVVTSLNGAGYQDVMVGMSSPLHITSTGFSVNILHQFEKRSHLEVLSPRFAELWKYNINWIAVGHVCS